MKSLLSQAKLEEKKGTTLLCYSRRDVPIVSGQIECPGGARREPQGKAGLANLAVDLINEGPKGFEPLEWDRRCDRNALRISLSPRDDWWTASFECLSEDLEETLDLLGRILADPALPAKEWPRLVKERQAAERESWAQPSDVMEPLVRIQALGPEHPNAMYPFEASYGRTTFEMAESMAKESFCKGEKNYGLIGGDISEEDGFRCLETLFDNMRGGAKPLPAEPPEAPSQNNAWLLDHPKLDQAFFALSRQGFRAAEPDRVALRLARYALAEGGFSSRLMTRLRVDMGQTYGISLSCPEKMTAAPFVLQSFTQCSSLEPMLDLLDKVLAEVVEDGFTSLEINDARDHLYGALPLRLTSPYATLRYVLEGIQTGLDPRQLESDWQSVPHVRDDEVNEAARRLLGDNKFRLAVIGPAAQLKKQIENRGPVTTIPFGTPPDRWAAADQSS